MKIRTHLCGLPKRAWPSTGQAAVSPTSGSRSRRAVLFEFRPAGSSLTWGKHATGITASSPGEHCLWVLRIVPWEKGQRLWGLSCLLSWFSSLWYSLVKPPCHQAYRSRLAWDGVVQISGDPDSTGTPGAPHYTRGVSGSLLGGNHPASPASPSLFTRLPRGCSHHPRRGAGTPWTVGRGMSPPAQSAAVGVAVAAAIWRSNSLE